MIFPLSAGIDLPKIIWNHRNLGYYLVFFISKSPMLRYKYIYIYLYIYITNYTYVQYIILDICIEFYRSMHPTANFPMDPRSPRQLSPLRCSRGGGQCTAAQDSRRQISQVTSGNPTPVTPVTPAIEAAKTLPFGHLT